MAIFDGDLDLAIEANGSFQMPSVVREAGTGFPLVKLGQSHRG